MQKLLDEGWVIKVIQAMGGGNVATGTNIAGLMVAPFASIMLLEKEE